MSANRVQQDICRECLHKGNTGRESPSLLWMSCAWVCYLDIGPNQPEDEANLEMSREVDRTMSCDIRRPLSQPSSALNFLTLSWHNCVLFKAA